MNKGLSRRIVGVRGRVPSRRQSGRRGSPRAESTSNLGRFDTKIEAAKARDRKAYELHGEFAYLNFPEGTMGGRRACEA